MSLNSEKRANETGGTEETGIQSSLNEDDMKLYLQQIMYEVKKPRSSN